MAAGAQDGDKLGTDQPRSTDDDDFHESLSYPMGIRCPIEKPEMAAAGVRTLRITAIRLPIQ
jgi:hypothetical protein